LIDAHPVEFRLFRDNLTEEFKYRADGRARREAVRVPRRRCTCYRRARRFPMSTKPSVLFAANRERVRRIVLAHRARNPRVFGSVARGEDTENSDLDLLVDTIDGTSLFDIAAIELELEALLGCPVHVATEGGLKGAVRERILADATPI
jgi:uncharacterized protein